MTTLPSCRLCGGATRLLFRSPDRFKASLRDYAVIECRHCGLAAIAPQPDPGEVGELYADDYYSYRPAPPRRPLSLPLGRSREQRRLRGHRLPAGARVLEIGCGSGASLDWHLQLGRECHGVEIGRQAVELAEARGIRMHLGQIEDAAYPDDHFDLVIATQVFEHVLDPLQWLAEIHRILRVDGRLVLSVPSHASLNRWLFGRHWIGYDVPRHCFSFSPATMKDVLGRAHFRCLAVDHVAGSYSLAASLALALHADRTPAEARAAVDRLAEARWLRLLTLPVALATDVLRVSDVIRVLAARE